MRRFFERVLTSAVLIGLSAYLLFFTSAFIFSCEVIAFAGLALYEFLTLLKKKGVHVYRVYGVAMGVIIPVIATVGLGFTQSGEVLFLVLGCLFLFVLQFFRKDNDQALVGISLTLFGILYVSWFLSFLIKIRFLEDGIWWVAYLLCVTKAADIGAYLVGVPLGKHSLIPHISPKKSVEGTVGGLIASAVVSMAMRQLVPQPLSVGHAALLGISISAIGQIGDLSESLMKRFCNAKDSGDVLPGMGGFLDSVDSILFTAPIFYYYLKVFAP